MRLLTVLEAAEYCRCSPQTIRRWIACGMLSASRFGRPYLIRQDDLEEILTRPPTGLSMEDYVQLIVDGAPTLTEEQLASLREALGRMA